MEDLAGSEHNIESESEEENTDANQTNYYGKEYN